MTYVKIISALLEIWGFVKKGLRYVRLDKKRSFKEAQQKEDLDNINRTTDPDEQENLFNKLNNSARSSDE